MEFGDQEQAFTIGVEEEYQIVDPETRALRGRAQRVLPDARQALGEEVQHELLLSQLETATPICHDLAAVRREVTRLRREVIAAAARHGSKIAAAGTHPFSRWQAQQITPKDRYLGLERDYARLARELVICGCHVHVGFDDPEGAVRVLNRVRPWLAPLLALSANSPYFEGADTGYASFRTELWNRWPTAGPPHHFASRREYDDLVAALVATGSIKDPTNLYWDVRLPATHPTIEFRVADVCATVEEAVMLAGLARALTRTCAEGARRDDPYAAACPELLRAAHWRAARHGLDADLIDPDGRRSIPAPEAVERLLAFVRPALEVEDDWDEVSALVRATLQHGNGAARQRAVYRRTGRLEDVVDSIIKETEKGIEGSEERIAPTLPH